MTAGVARDPGGMSDEDAPSKRLNDTPVGGKKSGGASVETALTLDRGDCAVTATGAGPNSVAV